MDYKIKDFFKEISVISKIEGLRFQDISIDDIPGSANITKQNKEFQISFKGIFKYPADGKLDINLSGEKYRVSSGTLKQTRFWSEIFDNVKGELTFDIKSMKRGDLKRNTSFRMFFFDTSKRKNLFHFKLESPKYDEIIPWAFDCVRITLDEKRYDIIQHQTTDQSYIIIENLDQVSYRDFQRDSYAIQKGIGYLVGYMPGGEHYIFSGLNFEYYRLARESLKSIYYPVTRNPYSFEFSNDYKNTADSYKEILMVIPSTVISKFVQQIRDNEEFSVAIIFLMEVLHLKSVVSMPGAFSVVLESLADIITNPSKIKTNLITDKNLATEIIEELHTVIDKYSTTLDDESVLKLKRRLSALNSPITPRRLTNAMKLREPFDQLGIILSSADEAAIEYRNYLLHGNILMNTDKPRNSEEIDIHMMYISGKLYTLLSKLLLKNCGFQGYVINHAKFFDSKEDPKEIYFFEKV
ncbi:hypothetical protein [Myroides guanonis]|uniref:ApeA N-terminal domain-containing protein n=1 Tax=Myroides guanonis TaxID=1150112 RepID=A0A1I3LMS9_9FLAO|nr:hypothetical protein [Myroides guanonis]SFI85795.1 hypothetical protein SAMN04487893_101392 [Myroides guanonis]